MEETQGTALDDGNAEAPVTYTKIENTDSHLRNAKKGSCADGSCESLGCGTKAPCGKLGCAGHAPAVPCDIAALEKQCTANPRCGGFNTDGWLKGCASTDCGADRRSVPGVDLYVSSRHITPPPPPPAPGPPLPPDPTFLARAKAAYGAVQRADGPEARWIYQGWALHVSGSGMSPPGPETLSRVQGFSSAAPPGKFILLDMAASGQWKQWHGTWGIPYIWTSLPDFGGDLYTHGNLSLINQVRTLSVDHSLSFALTHEAPHDQIPFEAPPLSPVPEGMERTFNPATQAVGVGYTPEGLDQNPAYYELLQEAAFKAAPEPDLTAWLVKRAHRRYGLTEPNADVASAWADLGASGYSNDGPVHDGSGVGKMPAAGFPPWMGFLDNRPKPALCLEWRAWGSMISAASAVAKPLPKTFTYDLVDVGREVLSQLTVRQQA